MTEIAFNEVMFAENSGGIQIHAGTYCVLPTSMCDDNTPGVFPDFLLISEGQSLKRESYPGWSAEYPGGFYDFNLPNLRDKFIIGFDEDGEAVMGTGCVYFKDIPEIPVFNRHEQVMD